MAFDKARTSLAQLEDKFRKAFNMAGTIGASFTPTITPIVNVADLNEPGFASFRGRHFAYMSDALSGFAATSVVGIIFTVPVVITEIIAVSQSGASGLLTAHYFSPTQGAGGVASSALAAILTRANAGTWVDQRDSSSDLLGFFDRTNVVADATVSAACTFQNRIAAWGGTFGQGAVTCGQLHIPAGGALVWHFGSAPATGIHVGCYGRIF